jgi:hypothetical protein
MCLSSVVLHIQQGTRTDPNIRIPKCIYDPNFSFVYTQSGATAGQIELGATSKAKCVMLVTCSIARTQAPMLTAGSGAKVCVSLQ